MQLISQSNKARLKMVKSNILNPSILRGLYFLPFMVIAFTAIFSCSNMSWTEASRIKNYPNLIDGTNIRYKGNFPSQDTHESVKKTIESMCIGYSIHFVVDFDKCIDIANNLTIHFKDGLFAYNPNLDDDPNYAYLEGLTLARRTIWINAGGQRNKLGKTAFHHEFVHVLLSETKGNGCATHDVICGFGDETNGLIQELRLESLDD